MIGALGSASSDTMSAFRAQKVIGGEDIAPTKNLQVWVTGSIESGQFIDHNELSCAYEFVIGADWKAHFGQLTGETQNSRNRPVDEYSPSTSWNFPIDMSFRSSNVSGWPRLAITVRDEQRNLVGYGSVYVPTTGGSCVRYCKLFAPLASTNIGQFIGKASSDLPEFYDMRFTTACKGREAARVASAGVVKVVFNTRITGKEALGYSS